MIRKIKEKRLDGMKFPGIRPIARELGITPGHLFKMLSGERPDPRGHCKHFHKRSAELYPRKAG